MAELYRATPNDANKPLRRALTGFLVGRFAGGEGRGRNAVLIANIQFMAARRGSRHSCRAK